MDYYGKESLLKYIDRLDPVQIRRVTARILKIVYNKEHPKDKTEKKIIEWLEKNDHAMENHGHGQTQQQHLL